MIMISLADRFLNAFPRTRKSSLAGFLTREADE
jgi:hypothetical protein